MVFIWEQYGFREQAVVEGVERDTGFTFRGDGSRGVGGVCRRDTFALLCNRAVGFSAICTAGFLTKYGTHDRIVASTWEGGRRESP
jgi:hypothetical protein